MTHWYDELLAKVNEIATGKDVPGLEHVMIYAEETQVLNEYDHVETERLLRAWSGIHRKDMKAFWVEQATLGM